MSSFKTFRIRFCEWQTFAINISATTEEDAIDLAKTIRCNHGTEPFEELDGDSTDWEAEEVQP